MRCRGWWLLNHGSWKCVRANAICYKFIRIPWRAILDFAHNAVDGHAVDVFNNSTTITGEGLL